MSVNPCRTVTAQIGRVSEQMGRAFMDSPAGPPVRWLRSRAMQSSNWLRGLSPAGEEIARGMDQIGPAHQRLRGRMLDTLDQWRKGVSEADRIAAAKVADGRLTQAEAGDRAWELGQRLKNELLDPVMNMHQSLGGTRLMPDGTRLPIEGSGRAFPNRLNRKGLEAINGDMESNPRVLGWAQKMVEEGKAKSVDDALSQMRKNRESTIRRLNPYAERTRVDTPEEWIEWDPLKSLPDWIEQQSLHIEGARVWGWNLERLDGMIERLAAETDRGTANIARNYFNTQFGKSEAPILKEDHQIHRAIRLYLRARIFGGTFLGPLRNYGQWITNPTDAPVSAYVKTVTKYPPIVGRFMKEGEQLRRMALRAGANPGEHPLTGWGLSARQTRADNFVDNATFIHNRVVGNNNIRAGVLGAMSLEANVNRMIELQGADSPLLRMWHSLRHLSVDPEGATKRAIERHGVSPERLSEILTEGGRMETADLEKAAAMISHSTQFGYTLASKPIMTGQSPLFNTLFFVKQWGVRQAGMIYENVLKEMAQGNAKPMVKFLLTTHALGEMYNLGRDVLTGSERSITMNALMNPGNNGIEATAFRMMRNIMDGGGVALLQDVLWGIGPAIGGPVGGTIANLKRGVEYIVSAPPGANPEIAARALVDIMDREAVATSQYLGVMRRVRQAVQRSEPRYFETNRVRQRAFEFKGSQDREEKGWGHFAQQEALAVVRGRGSSDPGEYTLSYQSFAAAVTGERQRDATASVREIMRTVPPRERRNVRDRFESAAERRSPLGPLTQAERREYLRTLSPGERRRTQELQREWMRDANAAIRAAQRQVR